MTALQMLRAILLRLSHSSPFLGDQSLAVPADTPSGLSHQPPGAEAFKRAFETVFLDDTGWVNLAAAIPANMASLVGVHALAACTQ